MYIIDVCIPKISDTMRRKIRLQSIKGVQHHLNYRVVTKQTEKGETD